MSYTNYGLTIDDIGEIANKTAVEHGWWKSDRNFGEVLALIHSEVSEALEVWRTDEFKSWNREDGKPEGVLSELADVIIRVCEYAHAMEFDLESAIREKMEFNNSRPYRHGNKLA